MADQKQVKASLVKREFAELSKVKDEFNEEQKAFVLKTIAPSLDQNELLLFLYRASKLGLNPLEGEIFAYTSHETINGVRVRKMVMIVARDGKRRVAYQTGHLKRITTEAIYTMTRDFPYFSFVLNEKTPEGEPPKYELKEIPGKTEKRSVRVKAWENGILWGATCIIERDDYKDPFVVTVPFKEYVRRNTIWSMKPETMIKKVAESQCLSLAFPDQLGGVYDESERFDTQEAEVVNGKLEDGSSPAKEEQIATIQKLGGNVTEGMTKQEAADTIKLLAKKGK